MTRRPIRSRPEQMDLLDWQPIEPVIAYSPERVKAATLARSIAKAVSETLATEKAAGRSREQVAAAMSEYLDETVSEHILNGYAGESRTDLTINIVRLDALLAITKDRRLLELLAARHGWAVIERRHLPAIELAQRLERREARRAAEDRDIEYLRRQLKSGGVA